MAVYAKGYENGMYDKQLANIRKRFDNGRPFFILTSELREDLAKFGPSSIDIELMDVCKGEGEAIRLTHNIMYPDFHINVEDIREESTKDIQYIPVDRSSLYTIAMFRDDDTLVESIFYMSTDTNELGRHIEYLKGQYPNRKFGIYKIGELVQDIKI